MNFPLDGMGCMYLWRLEGLGTIFPVFLKCILFEKCMSQKYTFPLPTASPDICEQYKQL